MRKLNLMIAVAALATVGAACGHETKTVVRRQTVETQTMAPAAPPVVIEKHTVIQPEPVVPQQRVYEERRTTIEE
jgi:hypothetical protein